MPVFPSRPGPNKFRLVPVEPVVVPPIPLPESIGYGLLYNWYAATDARNIAAVDWHVPIKTELDTLITYLGGDLIAGGKLKETGLTSWNTPNTGATNEVSFNGKGSGWRTSGVFVNLKGILYINSSTLLYGTFTYTLGVFYNNTTIHLDNADKKDGMSIRPLKDTTILTHGQTGTYVGNDGKVYRTICIGTQEWLADNLAETKFRTGESIPEVTDNAAWAALTSAGMCAYNNDWNNV